MKLARTKNATRNIFWGAIQKGYALFAPFITRTLFIYTLGIEYLGLNGLFGSVLSVLNLAELGVGNAMIFSMYQAIAEDDDEKICSLLKLYRFYYRVIGWVILVVGSFVALFLPYLIKSDLPSNVNLYVLYFMNLAVSVSGYWFFGYRNSLFSAFQRVDISSIISTCISIITTILQILILIFVPDYYLYMVIVIGMQIISNFIYAGVSIKTFPKYKPYGILPKEEVKSINRRVMDLFTSKVGAVVVNSVDTIVISAFLGLYVLAQYQNYYYIFSSIVGIVEIIFTSCIAGIGNSLITESTKKNYMDFQKLLFIIAWITGFCCTCFLCLYQPFITIWVGKKLLLNFSIVICLVIYFFVYEMDRVLNVYKDAAGMWHEDRFRPLATALANLTLNLIMVQHMGLFGIVLSTVISKLFVGIPWLTYNLFTVIFDHKYKKNFLQRMLFYVIVTFAGCLGTFVICNLFDGNVVSTFVVRLLICMILPNIIFIICYFKLPEFKQSMNLIATVTKGKIPFLNH